jgi:hypothetical protein
VVKHGGPGVELSFNYRTKFNDMWDDSMLIGKYGYTPVYPEAPGGGLTVIL